MTEIVEAEIVEEQKQEPGFRVEVRALPPGRHRKSEDSTPGTDDDIEDIDPFASSPEQTSQSGPETSDTKSGSPGSTQVRRPRGRPPGSGKKLPSKETPKEPPKLNIRPPDFSEWHDYMGDFVIKWMTRGYIAFVFRGIDRYEILSRAENDALELDAEDRHDIAKPLAHMADRSKLGKKYGRVIIDSSDGVTAMIHLGMWGARVNRIARKYRNPYKVGENEQFAGESGTGVSTEFPAEQPAYAGNGTRPPGIGYN